MKGLRAPVLVGLFLIGAIGALIFFVSIAGRKGLGRSSSYLVHMTFKDASGLAKRSRVVEAGIDIGKIETIELVHGKALVTVRIADQYPLYEDASVEKRSESILGDSLLDITPGTETLPTLKNGDEIKNVRTASGTDDIIASVKRITEQAEKVTGAIAGTVGSDQGKAEIETILKQLSETATKVNLASAQSAAQLAAILGDLEQLTRSIRKLAPAQEDQIVAILANVRQITESTKEAINSVNGMLSHQNGSVDTAMGQVKDALKRLDETLASAENVVQGVEKGQGTVGKLLRDQELANKLSHTIDGVTGYVDRLTGLKVEVGVQGEAHLQPLGGGKFAYPNIETVSVNLMPANSSRYYGFGIVSDSQGNFTHVVSQQTINGAPLTTVTNNYSETLRVNAFLAQRWGPATFRVGLIESTGGVGADLDLLPKWPRTLQVHAEAFDFTPLSGGLPRVRTSLDYGFAPNFDLYVGGDDLLNGPTPPPDPTGILTGPGRSVFAGLGFHFSDDDVKAILGMTGVPKP